jgi:signal recognition particle subunit SRP54
MDDLLKQLRMIQRLGPLRDVMAKMPGFGKLAEHVDESELGKVQAMIQSMTPTERTDPDSIDRSRASRIARGSGRQQSEVTDLVKRFRQMREMMAMLGGGGAGGLLSRLPGMGRLAGAGGLDPSMLSGLGGPTGRVRPISATTEARRRQAAKKKRKDAKKARKKGRRS